MSDRTVHVVIRPSEGMFYATSPQAPGFVYGRESYEELKKELDEALAFHFDTPAPFRVIEHRERHVQVDSGEVVIRIALDEHLKEREEVARRILSALRIPHQAEGLATAAVNRVGESVYVAAVPSDQLDWVYDQLDSRGDALTVATAISEGLVLTIPFSYGDGLVRSETGPVNELDSTVSTVGDLIRKTPVVQPVRPARTSA